VTESSSAIANLAISQAEEIAQLKQRVAELEAENRWIPVEESLPETERDVLIWNDIQHVGWQEQGVWFCGSREISCVTHWRPLPQKPITASSPNVK
jgi:hypothetical protein